MEGRIETNGNQEKGKEEKEALRKICTRQKGTRIASPKFLGGDFAPVDFPTCHPERSGCVAKRSSHAVEGPHTCLRNDGRAREFKRADRTVRIPDAPAMTVSTRPEPSAECASPSPDKDSDTRRNCSGSPASRRTCHLRSPAPRIPRDSAPPPAAPQTAS